MEVIECFLLVGGPEGGKEVFFGTVAGDAVNDGLFGEGLDAFFQDASIFLQGQGTDSSFFIFLSQAGVAEDVEKVEFHPVCTAFCRQPCGGHRIISG